MPRNLPQYTNCAAPGVAKPILSFNTIADMVIVAFISGGIAFAATVMISALVESAAFGCAWQIAVFFFLIAGLIQFKYWYYNERLLCIKHDVCVIGTVIDFPSDSSDGDRKFNLVLAPFTPGEQVRWLLETIEEKRIAGALNAPTPQELAVPGALKDFLNGADSYGLTSEKKINLYQTMVHEKMLDPLHPERNFYSHFLRKETVIDPLIAGAIPDDTYVPDGATNPMFRIGGDDDPYVFMHNEMEGYRLGAWLDNVLTGLTAGVILAIAICALALATGLGWIAPWLVALIIWLISHFTNDPNDYVAESVDVEIEDSNYDVPASIMTKGDIVVVFGNWIMDEEHENYFEIHPVKAWYLVCRLGNKFDIVDENDENNILCDFDPSTLTKNDADTICRLVSEAEKTDPPVIYKTSLNHALSMIGCIR